MCRLEHRHRHLKKAPKISTKFNQAQVSVDVSTELVDAAYDRIRTALLASRHQAGHWEGELSCSALSSATAISAMSFYLDAGAGQADQQSEIRRQIDAGFRWLCAQQNDDGGFGDTPLNYSNIATTMLVVAATHASGRANSNQEMLTKANRYVELQGSIEGLRKRYGTDETFAVPILANCAMAGIVPWKEVSAFPFEAACVPQRFYHLMQLPVVSYAIPALVAIGQAKFHFDPPWDPIRKTIRRLAVGRSLNVLKKMQPSSGGFLEAVPLTSFVSMGLIKTGKADHPVVERGIQFLIDSFRAEESTDESPQGSWPIDTNLATWSTTLSVNALAIDGNGLAASVRDDQQRWLACVDWILSCQNQTVHPFTGSPPGGWGWTDLPGAVPDADDTPGAMLALKNMLATEQFENRRPQILAAAKSGIGWLLKLQNRDQGWPTFCRGWGKFPFDRSGADITAHVIRGLLAWQGSCDQFDGAPFTRQQVAQSIDKGFRFLKRQQRSDGSWLPLWFGNQDQPNEENPFYGTAKVLAAYRDADRFDTNEARFGLEWLVGSQSDSGGWGGGPSVRWSDQTLGQCSVEETALCCEILLDSCNRNHVQSAWRGIEWLIRASDADCLQQCSPIGFYFAKLWYFEKSYPVIFATAALAKAKSKF